MVLVAETTAEKRKSRTSGARGLCEEKGAGDAHPDLIIPSEGGDPGHSTAGVKSISVAGRRGFGT